MILYEQEVANDNANNVNNSAATTTNATTLAALMGEGDDDDDDPNPTSTTAIKANRRHNRKSPQSSQSSSTWDESSDDDDDDDDYGDSDSGIIENYQEKRRIVIGESWPETSSTSKSAFHHGFNAILQQVETSSEAVTDDRGSRDTLQSKNSSSNIQQQDIDTSPNSSFDFPSLRTSPFTDPLTNSGSYSNPCKRSSISLCKDHELDETSTISSSSSSSSSSSYNSNNHDGVSRGRSCHYPPSSVIRRQRHHPWGLSTRDVSVSLSSQSNNNNNNNNENNYNHNHNNENSNDGVIQNRRSFLSRSVLLSTIITITTTTATTSSTTSTIANARGLIRFPCVDTPLSNTYHFMRAGTSLLELEDVWSTNPLFL